MQRPVPTFMLLLALALPEEGKAVAPGSAEVQRFSRISEGMGVLYSVSGCDVSAGLQAADVADKVVVGLADMTGLHISADKNRFIRVVIRNSPGPAGAVTVTHRIDGPLLTLSMDIRNPEKVSGEEIAEGLCRIILTECAVSRQSRNARGRIPVVVPLWLSTGLAQNMYSHLKFRNTEDMRRQWANGSAPGIRKILDDDDQTRKDAGFRKACGVVVGWLVSQPQPGQIFSQIIDRLAAGERVSSEWLAGKLPEAASQADMDESWDRWMHQLRRVVYEPGAITPGMIEDLKAQLCFSPGAYGVPAGDPMQGPMMPGDLIRVREAAWLDPAVRSRIVSLRLFEAGRPREIRDVAELFCAFLEGIMKKESDKRLIERLSVAEDELRNLCALVNGWKRYLDGVEDARRRPGSSRAASNDNYGGLESDICRAYIDGVEERLKARK